MADATEGGFVDEIRLKPVGSPAATVVRVFFCTVQRARSRRAHEHAANTSMIAELSLARSRSSNTVAQNDLAIPIRKALPAGYQAADGFGTSTGSAAPATR
jgi:hypothetical protein